jgi:chemotaxis protein MotB
MPEVLVSRPVWETSQTRANSVREMLIDAGLADERVERLTGFADRKPATTIPMQARNNRIEVILLRTRT